MTTVDQHTLEILTRCVVTDGSRAVFIEKPDRADRPRIDEALAAVGGPWNQKTKSYNFPGDAEVAIDRLCVLGGADAETNLNSFDTPPAVAEIVIKLANIRHGHRILEPSAGEGALVKASLRSGCADLTIVAVERDQRRRNASQRLAKDAEDEATVSIATLAGTNVPVDDFLDANFERDFGGEPFDRVIMCPPFEKVGAGDHLAHVHRAFDLLADGGLLVAVLPASVGFREDARHRGFRQWIENLGTINELPDSAFGFRTVVVRLLKAPVYQARRAA